MTKKKLISGLLIGAAAGAVIGFLFATDKGKEIRNGLAQKGTDLSDLVKSKVSHLGNFVKDELGNIVGVTKQTAQNKINEGMPYVSQAGVNS